MKTKLRYQYQFLGHFRIGKIIELMIFVSWLVCTYTIKHKGNDIFEKESGHTRPIFSLDKLMKSDIVHTLCTLSRSVSHFPTDYFLDDLVIQNRQVAIAIKLHPSHWDSVVNLNVSDCKVGYLYVTMAIAIYIMPVSLANAIYIDCHHVVLRENHN